MATKKKEERLKTGISGFDNLVQGGLISDSINLIMGNAGAGKTTFLLQFLYEGAVNQNQKGLFVSFECDKRYLHRNGISFGMDFDKLEKKGSCKIIKVTPQSSIEDLQETLMKIIVENDIRRVCLDPLNVFSLNLPKEESLRKQIYDLLSFLRGLNVCVLVAGESDEEAGGGHKITPEIKFSKYLSDSVIELFSSGITGEGDRAVRITKMRMTDHYRWPVAFKIGKNGIDVQNISKEEKDLLKKEKDEDSEELANRILKKGKKPKKASKKKKSDKK